MLCKFPRRTTGVITYSFVESGIVVVERGVEELTNPVGLAAGFDKHGEAIDGKCTFPACCVPLFCPQGASSALRESFSWLEVGSVTQEQRLCLYPLTLPERNRGSPILSQYSPAIYLTTL